ncbi:MAG: hypothetical protein WCG80_19265 [Spirochaetales bacterium]
MTEQKLRNAVALCLWTLSGAVMASLFWTLAGESPVARVIGTVWALCLTAAQILLWRYGGWRRWITVGLECLLLFSAVTMAWSRIEDARARELLRQLISAGRVAIPKSVETIPRTEKQTMEASSWQV